MLFLIDLKKLVVLAKFANQESKNKVSVKMTNMLKWKIIVKLKYQTSYLENKTNLSGRLITIII